MRTIKTVHGPLDGMTIEVESAHVFPGRHPYEEVVYLARPTSINLGGRKPMVTVLTVAYGRQPETELFELAVPEDLQQIPLDHKQFTVVGDWWRSYNSNGGAWTWEPWFKFEHPADDPGPQGEPGEQGKPVHDTAPAEAE